VKLPWLALVALAACSHGESDAATVALPKLQLSPVVPELEQLRDGGPARPEQRVMDQLLDLGRSAFAPDADARLGPRCRRSLMGEPDAPWALEELLADAQPIVRARAAAALGELGRQPSIVPMLRRLKDEKDPMVRTWLAAGLAQLGCGGGFADLVVAMNQADTAQDAGTQAIAILKRAGREPGEQPTWQSLQDGLIALEREWLDRGLLPPATADPVADALLTARVCDRLLLLKGFDLRPVDETKYILGRAGRVGLPLLRRAVLAEDLFLRTHALQILKQLGRAATDLAPLVLPLLGDADRGCRIAAAEALAAMRCAAAAPFVRAWLADADNELRTAAAACLGPMGDRAAEPLLRARMADAAESMDVRVQAAFSIALFERERPGIHFLRERLAAGDYHEPTVRELIDRAEAWR
jgi:HEAT repeat protein